MTIKFKPKEGDLYTARVVIEAHKFVVTSFTGHRPGDRTSQVASSLEEAIRLHRQSPRSIIYAHRTRVAGVPFIDEAVPVCDKIIRTIDLIQGTRYSEILA